LQPEKGKKVENWAVVYRLLSCPENGVDKYHKYHNAKISIFYKTPAKKTIAHYSYSIDIPDVLTPFFS